MFTEIKDGLTIHLVIKTGNRPSATGVNPAPQTGSPNPAPTNPTTQAGNNTPAANPFGDIFGMSGLGGMGGLGGMPGLGNLGGLGGLGGLGNGMGMENIINNPEMIRQMMDSPLMREMMNSPEMLRSIMMSNPQMRQLMETNPEIAHMLNNPDILRQTMNMMRNPAAFQELMRSQDRAMSNLESIPGGYNALRRMYTELQEPMLNAAQEGFGTQNPFAALSSGARQPGVQGDSQPPSGTENREPLPNPWAPRSTSQSSTPSNQQPSPNLPSGLRDPMLGSPGIQSLMNQFINNPTLMQSVMNSPMMQNMMQALSANPDLANQMLQNNPLLASNPALREQMRLVMPQMMQSMNTPQVQQMLNNPEALEAMMLIQRGMEQLQRVAPDALG